jgi:hypothetical protein
MQQLVFVLECHSYRPSLCLGWQGSVCWRFGIEPKKKWTSPFSSFFILDAFIYQEVIQRILKIN